MHRLRMLLAIISACLACACFLAQAAYAQASSLSPEAFQMAQELHITELLDELAVLKRQNPDSKQRRSNIELIAVRQEIDEIMRAASLQIDEARARVEIQLSRTEATHELLTDKRDRAVAINNVSNFVVSGVLNTIGPALQLATPVIYQGAGNIVEGLAGVAQVGISTGGIWLNRGQKKVDTEQIDMLAKFFEGERSVNEWSDYPPFAWNFLNSTVPGSDSKKTRREQLMERWILLGRLDKKQKKAPKILGRSPDSANGARVFGIGSLEDRLNMLNDIHSELAMMNRPLLEISNLIMQP